MGLRKRGRGYKQAAYVGKGRGRRFMWGRGNADNMYGLGEKVNGLGGDGEKQTVYFWKGTGGRRGQAG